MCVFLLDLPSGIPPGGSLVIRGLYGVLKIELMSVACVTNPLPTHRPINTLTPVCSPSSEEKGLRSPKMLEDSWDLQTGAVNWFGGVKPPLSPSLCFRRRAEMDTNSKKGFILYLMIQLLGCTGQCVP